MNSDIAEIFAVLLMLLALVLIGNDIRSDVRQIERHLAQRLAEGD